LVTKQEARTFIDKHHLAIPDIHYAQLSYQIANLDETFTRFAARGEEEKASITRLQDFIAKIQTENLATIPGLSSKEAFEDV
jgi:hypothetical protein